jgi:hypothetical protein
LRMSPGRIIVRAGMFGACRRWWTLLFPATRLERRV